MDVEEPELLSCMPDYRLNLIEPAAMGAEDFAMFHSDLGDVLGFIKYSEDLDELEAFLSKADRMRDLDAEAARVIRECTGIEIRIDEKAETVDVHEAVREIWKA